MWLLEQSVFAQLKHARRSIAASADRIAEFRASAVSASAGKPRNLKLAADAAQVDVVGVLTQEPDFWLWLLGIPNTTYRDIRSALAIADSDPSVSTITLYIDSPGGEVGGLFETIAAMRAVTKPLSVVAASAASAAYGLAANGGKITASNPASSFGSVGVVAEYILDDSVVSITSTDAPNKRPDLTTEDGQAVVRDYLDQLHALFAGAIAQGRGVTVETVNSEFGRGSMFVASEAKARGMIDAVAANASASTNKSASAAGGEEGRISMKWNDYKAAHPTEAAEGITEGKAAEQKRVKAHLKAGEACGDMSIAIRAINDGTPFADEELQAEYFAAKMSKADRTDRASDEKTVIEATAKVESAPKGKDLGDLLADRLGAPTL